MAKLKQRRQPAKEDIKTPAVQTKEDPTTEINNPNSFQRLCSYMFEPDDASYIAVFRIMWGLIMMDEIWGHIKQDFGKSLSSWYQNPNFMYKYWALEWATPLDIEYMKIFLVIMLIFGFFITIGFLYRISAIGFTLGFIYIYALEAALYLNHFYLVIVMSAMLTFLPCNVYFSVDALIWPNYAKKTVPKWCLWVIKLELWIVYTYAGVAKLNIDWLRGEPLRHWLLKRLRYPIVGWMLQYEPVIYWFSYSGLIYDLIIGTLLIYPRTFLIGVYSTVFFHTMNKYIFNIGIFPMLMLACTFLFFEPYWPRRLIHWFTQISKNRPVPFNPGYPITPYKKIRVRKLKLSEKLILLLAFSFLAQQTLTPLRYYLYPGNVFWHEHGHRYSWRMKLRDKNCDGELYTYEHATNKWYEFPLTSILTPRQYGKFTSRPEFVLQSIHYARDTVLMKKNTTTEMYCYIVCQVNYRTPALMTNPYKDLANEPVWEWPYDWITEMPELTPEQTAEIPWNWSLNFNWIYNFPWESNYNKVIQDQNETLRVMNETVSGFKEDFRRFIADKKYGGDLRKASQNELHYVNEEKKIKSRNEARSGLLVR